MKLEIPLLGLLAARKMSGYDIKRWCEVEGKFSGLDRHPSQIYRELNRMQVDGVIDFEVDPRDGAPDAKSYDVTPAGMERLRRWSRSAYVPSRRFQDPEFLFRLRIAFMLGEPSPQSLVQQELDARIQQVRDNRDRPRDTISDGHRSDIDAAGLEYAGRVMRSYGEHAIDQWIDWLSELQQQLDTRAAEQSEPAPVLPHEVH